MMKSTKRRIISIVMMAVLAFITFSSVLEKPEVYAASKKLPKKIKLSASVDGQTNVDLKWNKIKKPNNGYAVFRDGKCIARLGKKWTSYYDINSGSTSGHTYQIKTYKKVKKRVKGKKRTVYKYLKASNVVSLTTAKSTKTGNRSSTLGNIPASVTQIDNLTWKVTLAQYNDGKYHYGTTIYIDAWIEGATDDPWWYIEDGNVVINKKNMAVVSVYCDDVLQDTKKKWSHESIYLLNADKDNDGIVIVKFKGILGDDLDVYSKVSLQ